jgi:hypothetical protein
MTGGSFNSMLSYSLRPTLAFSSHRKINAIPGYVWASSRSSFSDGPLAEVGQSWRTSCLKPSTDVDLGMCLSAEVTRTVGVCSRSAPLAEREIGISALNDVPMNGIT